MEIGKFLLYSQLILAVLVVIILISSVAAIYFWSRFEQLKPDLAKEKAPRISIVLPTWNEEKVILGKLENIYSQDYPKELLEVIIIDANSSDKTLDIVEKWINDKGLQKGNSIKIIKEKERRGKSVSINTAFGSASIDSEILMMSDVDCRLSDDAISRVARWFNNEEIGAVTGRQVLLNPSISKKTSEEESYRNFFTKIRIAESKLHSTPIFHGECAAYRKKALDGHKLVENANADDSQMAVSVIRSGFKAIYDPEITFFEMAPADGNANRIQKVRRAQGLVRHFWRNSDMLLDQSFGKFRRILALEYSLHILCPVLVVLGFIFGLGHISIVFTDPNFDLKSLTMFGGLSSTMILIDVIVALLLICGFLDIPFPLSKLSTTFLYYMLTLFWAQMLIIFGRSLHKWQQVPTVRESLKDYDKSK